MIIIPSWISDEALKKAINEKTLIVLIYKKYEKKALELLKNKKIDYKKFYGLGYTTLYYAILLTMDELSSELLK